MPPTPDTLALIHSGLPPRTTRPKKVIVVGAGMAGLVAAYELLRAGHDPLILEAQQRVGGRVYTLRAPFTHGLYAEAGAMRLPSAHKLTLAYVEKFKLPLARFTMGNPQAYSYVGGQRYRIAEVNANPTGWASTSRRTSAGRRPPSCSGRARRCSTSCAPRARPRGPNSSRSTINTRRASF
jgi:monoamine oxidase